MKRRGPEYDWDDFIPPGCDDVAEISNSEKGKLRFELELAQRLNHLLSWTFLSTQSRHKLNSEILCKAMAQTSSRMYVGTLWQS